MCENGRALDDADVPFLLPHEVYDDMHRKSPLLFRMSVLGTMPMSAVLDVWEHALLEPWGAQHPVM